MTHEILRPDKWEELVEYCRANKLEVPDKDTTFVCVGRDAAGKVTGFIPVQPAYAAGPAHGHLNCYQALDTIDDHFAMHFGSYGMQYFWFHPKNAETAQIRTLQKAAKTA